MSLLAAIAFLTILPLPGRVRLQSRHLARSVRWYPLVGLALGGLLAGLDVLLGQVLAEPARNALVIVAALVLTGALHLDGLMDACDGLLAPVSPERRLEIMRDSHVGSFGIAAAGLVLIGKYAALASLADTPRWAALVCAAVLGRWAMTLGVVLFPAGRTEGLGRLVKQAARPSDLLIGGLTAAIVCGLALGSAGLLLWLTATAIAWLAARFAARRLPGLSGDTYGALDELVEFAALALVPVCLRAAW